MSMMRTKPTIVSAGIGPCWPSAVDMVVPRGSSSTKGVGEVRAAFFLMPFYSEIAVSKHSIGIENKAINYKRTGTPLLFEKSACLLFAATPPNSSLIKIEQT